MATIIRGTTPEIEIVFNATDPRTFDTAVLTVCKGATTILTRDLSSADSVTGQSVKWSLTQEETLSLTNGDSLSVTCVWVTSDGVRGQSKTAVFYISDTPINEVL